MRLAAMFDSQHVHRELSKESISTTLLERIRLHDTAAWRRFVHLYGPVIYRWAKRARLQSSDAADVAQEVFQAVAVNIDQFHRDHTGGRFRGWLWGITHHKLRDHFRRAAAAPG